MPQITTEELRQYERVTAVQRQVGEVGEWTDEVMQYCLHGENMAGMKLPWPFLDERFRFHDGETTVMCGQSGAGKSLLAGQVALHGMEQKVPALIVSLEMQPRSSIARMVRQRSLQAQPGMDDVLDFARWSKGKLWFYRQQGSINFKTLLAVLRYTVDNYGVKFIVIDSMMTMGDIPSDDYQGQKRLVLALTTAARDSGAHIMLITHARTTASIDQKLDKFSVAGSADITNLADNVMLLQRTHTTEPAAPDATFQICKARHFDQGEVTTDLWLDLASMNYYTQWDSPRVVGENDEDEFSKSEGTTPTEVGEITVIDGAKGTSRKHRVPLNGGSRRGSDAVATG